MQKDFHYYATYCAAFLAGYSHEDALKIAYSAQLVDCCSRTLLSKLRAPLSAATTQRAARRSSITAASPWPKPRSGARSWRN